MPGAPVVSAGGVSSHWLKGARSATLELGASMEAFDSPPETPIRTDLPPLLPDSQPPTPPTSYRSRYPDAVFTVDYHKGWKTCMAVVMKNFGWQKYCVLDRNDNRYEITDDAGTLDSDPYPSSFPIFLMEKKNLPPVTTTSDVDPTLKGGSPQTPKEAAPKELEVDPLESAPKEPEVIAPKEPEVIAPKEPKVGDQSGAKPTMGPGVGEAKCQKPSPPSEKAVESSIYADGSYWKLLDTIISSIFFYVNLDYSHKKMKGLKAADI